MVVSLSEALQKRQEKFAFSGQETLEPYGAYEFTAPADVKGECMLARDEVVFVKGEMSFSARTQCALCVKEVTAVVRADFEEKFVKGQAEDDEYGYDGESLNLSRMLSESAILSLPLRMLCKEDCKGICPVCGIDLNSGVCSCSKEEDNAFSVLKTLDLTEEV